MIHNETAEPPVFQKGQVWLSPPFGNGERIACLVQEYNANPDCSDFRRVYQMSVGPDGQVYRGLSGTTSQSEAWLAAEGWTCLGTLEDWIERALQEKLS